MDCRIQAIFGVEAGSFLNVNPDRFAKQIPLGRRQSPDGAGPRGEWPRTLRTIQTLRITSDQSNVRTQILDCRRWNENGMRATPTYSWFRYCPSSLTDPPPAVRDVELENDGLCFPVSRAGRSHAFPDLPSSGANRSPGPWSSLSLSH